MKMKNAMPSVAAGMCSGAAAETIQLLHLNHPIGFPAAK